MDNGKSTITSRPIRELHPRRIGNLSLLTKMILLAVIVHIVLILLTSRSLFFSDKETPEEIYKRGEDAIAAGKYMEAMDHFQKVLDLQPKLPPVFEKAAEQHRNAERLAKLAAARPATTTAPLEIPVTTRPIPVKVTPATKQSPEEFIPPELRSK